MEGEMTVAHQVLGMNGGIGDTSYASNSLPQQKVINVAKPITDRAITSLYTSLNNPKTISIADLGCSSGPNTLLTVSNLVKAVDKLGQHSPEFQGIVEEEKLNSFNFPVYTPSLPEVKSLIEKDGSFTINCLEAFQVHWTGNNEESEDNNDDNIISYKKNDEYKVARHVRAATEPTLVSHFGEGIIEKVFPKYTNNIADSMSKEKTEYTNLIVSLVKK